MKFEFRIRFHLEETTHVNSDLVEFEILKLDNGPTLKIKGGYGKTISESNRLTIIGGPYATEQEATIAAYQARTALLIWATKNRIGIDLGSDYQRSHITDMGLSLLAAEHKEPVRNDVHGIDVYEKSGNVKFASLNIGVNLGKNAETLQIDFQQIFLSDREYPDKLKLACELYCSAFFDPLLEGRFILLVTAVEALLDPADRASGAVELVKDFIQDVKNSKLTQSDKDPLVAALKFIQKESIGQTGKKLAITKLPESLYQDMASDEFFKYCYGIRSSIVHIGKCKLTKTELANLTNTCLQFVGDLLAKLISESSS